MKSVVSQSSWAEDCNSGGGGLTGEALGKRDQGLAREQH